MDKKSEVEALEADGTIVGLVAVVTNAVASVSRSNDESAHVVGGSSSGMTGVYVGHREKKKQLLVGLVSGAGRKSQAYNRKKAFKRQ